MRLAVLTRTQIVAAVAAATALATGAAVGSAQPTAAKPTRTAEQMVSVELQGGTIGYTPGHVAAGRMTLAVHNGRKQPTTFIIARHTGGMPTLPKYSGMPFIPREEIVARLLQLAPGTKQQLRLTLAHGNYAVLTSKRVLNGDSPIIVDSAASFAVS